MNVVDLFTVNYFPCFGNLFLSKTSGEKTKIFLSAPTIVEVAGDFISGFSDIPQSSHACKQYNIFRRGKITKTEMVCYSKWYDFISKMWSSTILGVSAFSLTLKLPRWATTTANQNLENLWKFSHLSLKEIRVGPQENFSKSGDTILKHKQLIWDSAFHVYKGSKCWSWESVSWGHLNVFKSSHGELTC